MFQSTKHILILTVLLFLSKSSLCQDRKKCIEISDLIFKSIEQKNPELIVPYLSHNFTMASQKMPISKKVFIQLINSLEIESYKLSDITHKNLLALNYNVSYKNIGEKNAVVIFNDKNLIERLELLIIEVKKLEPNEAKIVSYDTENFIEIPFQKIRNLIVVKAKVDGVERSFILDTGAPYTLINSKYLKLDERDSIKNNIDNVKGVAKNSISGADIIENCDIDFYGIKSMNQKTLTIDISHLLGTNEIEIYGLIGYDFIKNYDILFDYENNMLTLIKPTYFQKYKEKKLNQYSKETIVPLSMRGHIPILDIQISDSNYRMGVDSGAEANLLGDKYFFKIKPNLEKIVKDSITGISNKKRLSKLGILKKMNVGGIMYKDTQVCFSNIQHLNKEKEQFIDGLVGFKLLSKQLTLLSYNRKELIFFK